MDCTHLGLRVVYDVLYWLCMADGALVMHAVVDGDLLNLRVLHDIDGTVHGLLQNFPTFLALLHPIIFCLPQFVLSDSL